MLKVLSIIGTRPEGIKMAPVLQELARYPDSIHSVICSTGQHREMLDQVMQLFAIVPDIDLNLMQFNQGLAQLTSRLIASLDDVMADVKPDVVLAQGDTTTVLAASLVSFYRNIKFGHIEAGLRTGDRRRPFPEEINRRIADVVTDYYFAPTQLSRAALLIENIPDKQIFVTGNTVIDALLQVANYPYQWESGPLRDLPRENQFVLITAHRRESFGDQFKELCLAIRDLAQEFRVQGYHFVYPVHLNPNVRTPVNEILSDVSNISLIEPLDYLSLVQLMKRSKLILTDSGGIQEEAPSFGIPVLVMRDTTERPEGVNAGVVKLVGTQRSVITNEARRLLSDPVAYASMANHANPYGDGQASQRIVSALLESH